MTVDFGQIVEIFVGTFEKSKAHCIQWHKMNSQEGSSWVWHHPMKDDVTLYRHLPLTEPIPKMNLESVYDLDEQKFNVKQINSGRLLHCVPFAIYH